MAKKIIAAESIETPEEMAHFENSGFVGVAGICNECDELSVDELKQVISYCEERTNELQRKDIEELETQMREIQTKLMALKGTRLPTSFLALYSICYVEFSITLSLYFINQHITGYHRIDVEAIPCAPEQIKTLKTSKPFRNTCTSVDS